MANVQHAALTGAELHEPKGIASANDREVYVADGGGSGSFEKMTEAFIVAISDETSSISTGTAKVTFRMPYAFTITEVRASLTTASSSGTPTFDINKNGATILSTKITIDSNEKTSETAAAPPVVSTSALADDDEIKIDIDVAGTSAAGAKIYIIGHRS